MAAKGSGAVAPASSIDWALLRRQAQEMTQRSYAPYSGVRVGAAGLSAGAPGEVLVGCNVENACYGVGLCAECSLVSDLARRGSGPLVAVSIVAGDGKPVAPCGRCRQLLYEFGGETLLIDGGEEPGSAPVRLGELLPDAFGPRDVEQRRG